MSIDTRPFISALGRLEKKGICFESGLTDGEVAEVEHRFSFRFPRDLRCFLQLALPVSPYFVNWRGGLEALGSGLDWPLPGVLFDVENGVFWNPGWGARPGDSVDAIAVAKRHLATVPKLIPIGDFIYRKCISATPAEAGNPVFSIHQTDILHAGRDLLDFLGWFSRPKEDFALDEANGFTPTPIYSADYRHIEFWTDLVKQNVGS